MDIFLNDCLCVICPGGICPGCHILGTTNQILTKLGTGHASLHKLCKYCQNSNTITTQLNHENTFLPENAPILVVHASY